MGASTSTDLFCWQFLAVIKMVNILRHSTHYPALPAKGMKVENRLHFHTCFFRYLPTNHVQVVISPPRTTGVNTQKEFSTVFHVEHFLRFLAEFTLKPSD